MAFEAKYVGDGVFIDYTPSVAVVAGQVIEQVNLIGVANTPISANILGSLAVEGVFDFAKTASLVVNVGDLVYWDDTLNEANKTLTSNVYIGKCVKASAAADTTVRVKLDQ